MTMATTISRSVIARTVAVLRLRRPVGTGLATLLCLLATLAVAAPLHAQLSSNPGIFIADFNHDGIPDVLAPSPATSSFTLSFGSVPFGTFGATARSVPFPAGCSATIQGAVVVADFNGDGFPDLAITCDSSPTRGVVYQGYVMLGSGDGSFTVTSTFVGQINLLAADFDKDGNVDLVTAGSDGTSNPQAIVLLKGKGDGTFAAGVMTPVASTRYTAAIAADLNNDGYPEVVLGNFGGANALTVDVYGNNKDGTFGTQATTYTPTVSIPVGTYPQSADETILAGNFYGTGLTDLAVVDVDSPGVFVIQNSSTSDGLQFGDAVKTSVPGLVGATAGSFTSTLSDLLVSNGTKLTVLANNGSGTFTPSYTGLSVASTSTMYAAADANLDGHADIYTAALTATGVSLAVNLVSGTASASSTPFSLPQGSSPVSAAWPGNVNFTGTTLTGTQIVGGLTPIITWPTPAAIAYGTALSGTQLDATAATAGGVVIPGTFVYTPAAGTVLGVGTHTLNVVFTPTDLVTYTVANGTTSLVVNRATPLVTWTPAVASIVYGTHLDGSQLNAAATGAGGTALAGTFVYTPAGGTVLGAGPHTLSVVFTPTDAADYVATTRTAQISVTRATPTVSWATPAPIAYGIPLSAAQLDATATGINGAALPGAFVYTPAAGSTPKPGIDTLSVLFTPTDFANYTAASQTVNITITDVTLGSFAPNTVALGSPATTITATGSGLVSTTVVEVNGTAIPTTLVNPTTLTAVIPASDFLAPGTLEVTLSNPATGSVSNTVNLTVTAPPISGTLVGPSTTAPGTQPSLTFNIAPYPVDITATFTVSLKSSLPSGVTDAKNVVFADGSATYTFTIPAGSTSIPAITLAAGTVAETITVTPSLFIGTVDVTPDDLAPVSIEVPAAVPEAMSTTITRSGNQLTVKVTGFSNTREVTSAAFHFIASPGATLSQPDVSPSVDGIFTTWFDDPTSPDFGSSFTYTQVFNVSDSAANIGSVQVTLTNSVGASTPETAQ